VTEAAPTDAYFQNILTHLVSLAAHKLDILVTMRQYVGKWARWLKLGLSTIEEFETNVQTLLPSLFSCCIPGSVVFSLGDCR
jgi:hypothetical protein